MSLVLPPLSLYVHLPWCVRKCPYCDFNSHPAPAGRSLPERDYVHALLQDLEEDSRWVAGRPLVSVFIGGGTPSLFSPESIDLLLAGVRDRIECPPGLEVTLEANPGTIERGRFAGYREAGVTRVSLGVQSFAPDQLALLGRIHSPDDCRDAVAELKAAGLANFNLDLMYGLPGQTVDEAVADVSAAIALDPQHLSHYQLTLEPGTVFHHRPPAGLPETDAVWDMQLACQAELQRHGFGQYEISAYARPGRRCAHNLNYWRFGDYLGLGAGAHGKLTDLRQGRIVRTTRYKQPRTYLAADPAGRLEKLEAVDPADLPFEYMLNRLRLREGFSVAQFEQATGIEGSRIAAALSQAQERGLLVFQPPGEWSLSDLGWRFANDVQALFLP